MSAVIRAISGPLRGAIFRLGQEEVTIGRQPSNHLCIGDLSVSRFHCVIKAEEGHYKVKDLHSHNGTLVNGNPVTESFLKIGDQLGIGDTVFEFLEHLNTPDFPVPISEWETVASLTIPAERKSSPQDASQPAKPSSNALAALAHIGKLLNSAHDVEHLGVEILDAICDFLAADRAAVFIARRGEWVAFAWDRQEGQCEAAFAKREIVDQVFNQGRFVIATSVLAIPLVVRDVVRGVIYLERCTGEQPFADADLDFISAVSNYVAISLDYSQKVEELQAENRRMREEVQLRHRMVGHSPRMREMYNRLARIAPSDATVLIRGETGTGKELAARAIHDNSPRAAQTFEAINCALLKRELLESELFGHEKGAFTGAISQKKGKLELANRGTLFLDEVAELPEQPQSMLLRFLQEHVFERLGGTSGIRVDIRIIAATNKNLEEAVHSHNFREDLYYRLNVVSVHMPPLRERRDDIPLLAEHFLRSMSEKNNRVVTGISHDAMAYLKAYDWPGNVRELENAIQHAVVFGSTGQIVPEDLPERILTKARNSAVPGIDYQDAVRSAKRQIVLDALQQAKGDHSEAAKLLRIHPNNLYRLIRDLDIKPR